MFIAIVQIALTRRSCGAAVAAAARSAPTYGALGARGLVRYYDNHVVVDNEAGKVRIEE